MCEGKNRMRATKNYTPIQVVADLDIACENTNSQISIFRAEEPARADLAQANSNGLTWKN